MTDEIVHLRIDLPKGAMLHINNEASSRYVLVWLDKDFGHLMSKEVLKK